MREFSRTKRKKERVLKGPTEYSYSLIREQFDVNDIEQIRKQGRPTSINTMCNVLCSLAIKSGVRQVNHNATGRERQPIPLAHGFRKFFTTQLIHCISTGYIHIPRDVYTIPWDKKLAEDLIKNEKVFGTDTVNITIPIEVQYTVKFLTGNIGRTSFGMDDFLNFTYDKLEESAKKYESPYLEELRRKSRPYG
jgi:hypothetical protein